jgi:16S rRNA (cytosine967-C5)-methyltransferase
MPPDELLVEARARLERVPWAELPGLLPLLDEPLALVLDGAPADRTLTHLLRAHRTFTGAQRAVVAEALFGVGLWRRRLRAALPLPQPTPRQLLLALARDLGGTALDPTLPPSRELPDYRDATSIPDWLAEVLEAEAGPDAPRLAASLAVPGPIFLRANTLRTTREALAARLAELGVGTLVTRWARDGLEVTSPRPNLLGLGLDGLFEVQDEGSQLLAELLQVQPGDQVADVCAGAGGKALALAAHAGPEGQVHCADVDAPRLDRLRLRAARAHAPVAIHGAALPPGLLLPRVLLDAPCSELGALRRGPDLRWRLDPAAFSRWPALQGALLDDALSHLAPGGRLVYATCTLRREENEAVVEAALARHPELRLLPGGPPALRRGAFFHTSPHLHRTDAFFAAILTR